MEREKRGRKVFLSYAKTDQELAHALSDELKRYGLSVWDDQSIPPGADWSREIKKALQHCDSMIALLNEHSFSSSYVREELQHAFFDERYRNRLLPVLLGKTSDADFSRLPWILTKLAFLRVSEKERPQEVAKKITKRFLAQIKGGGEAAG
jgi:hypothetical protein